MNQNNTPTKYFAKKQDWIKEILSKSNLTIILQNINL